MSIAPHVGRVLPALLALSLVGCIPPIYFDRQDYPADWPLQAVPAEGACPELTGRYQNQGDGRFPVRLASLVDRATADPLKLVQHVSFDSSEPGVVSVKLFDAHGKTMLEQRWVDGRDYRCEDGWLIRRHAYFWATPVLTGTDSERFARSETGELLAQKTTEAGGVVLVLPVYRGERFWFRYPRLPE